VKLSSNIRTACVRSRTCKQIYVRTRFRGLNPRDVKRICPSDSTNPSCVLYRNETFYTNVIPDCLLPIAKNQIRFRTRDRVQGARTIEWRPFRYSSLDVRTSCRPVVISPRPAIIIVKKLDVSFVVLYTRDGSRLRRFGNKLF